MGDTEVNIQNEIGPANAVDQSVDGCQQVDNGQQEKNGHEEGNGHQENDAERGDSDEKVVRPSVSDSNDGRVDDGRVDDGRVDDGRVDDGQHDERKLSKNQLKKLRKKEYWENIRQERRKEERRRKQKRRADAAANGESSGPKRKRCKASGDANCSITVAIDMSLDEYMNEKDTKKALNQVQYCYSANRRSQLPINLYVTGFRGNSRTMFDQTRGCSNWDGNRIVPEKNDYWTLFPKDQLVYLSSESPNILETLEDDKVYIIGGLVDHNVHKGLCHRIAQEKDIKHARLPIDEYVVMKSRKVLTINHVFEIMLKYKETNDWEKAFFHVLPKRKEVKKKDE